MLPYNTLFSELTVINDNIVDTNEAYLNLNKKIIKTLKVISSYMPEDKLFLLTNLEELYADKECVLETIIYNELLSNSKKILLDYDNIIHIQKDTI
ncbi:hypothetical protein [uncultured Clostridium sp.]|jgi:hypothetical protein|uniref:hypothetical protein n=1 Tax=uncultured Clostridium sp. TaxID=59620 RepID=UPI00258726BB|nr:hypothetical protein [uncultured Clostridium sp.]